MAIRPGMVDLIERVRSTIGDTGTTPVFADEEIQSALDERRAEVSGVPLQADYPLTGSPTAFRAPYGFWETDAIVSNGSGGALTASGSATDPIAGVWAFVTAPGATVYLTGRVYDLWGTAANLLEQWAAKVALEFDFATDQQRFDRSQKRVGLLQVAREFGRRAVQPGSRTWGSTWRQS